jgi:transposase-like protein
MADWSDEKKAKAVELYLEGNPTPENSMEVVKSVAEELNESANGVRMILTKADVYIKKEAAKSSSKAAASGDKPASTRVSKEDAHAQLTAAIEATGAVADTEIVSKLTGKAALYLAGIIASK